MRLIPGKTKVKMELFRGVSLSDIAVGLVTLGLAALVFLSTIPGRMYIAAGVLTVGIALLIRVDDQANYKLLLGLIRYLAQPRRYWRMFSDKHLLSKKGEINKGDDWKNFFSESIEHEEDYSLRDKIERIMTDKKQRREEEELLNSGDLTDEEKNAIWQERKEKEEAENRCKEEEPQSYKGDKDVDSVMAFTGISEGFIEYDGKYYGAVIEVDPVEFRFFSKYRRDASIENCLGKIIRSLKIDYSANLVKIDRPIIYDEYLEKEYDKLDELKVSYEKGLLSEDELKSRVEIQYDRINAMREICFEEKVIQPFYYLVFFNINKRQLDVEIDNAITILTQGELTVRRISAEKELAVFLKYTNSLDFDERDVEKLDPKDYAAWAMPESLAFNSRRVDINGVVTHQMRVVGYPSDVGDAWLAGVMSIPATKVVVKITPMERTRSIRAIDRSLSELRGQLNSTGIDSKRIELESHIETLSRLLVTLQQDNEALLSVNIYISMYDIIRTTELGHKDAANNSSLAVIADMKKNVRRTWQETGIKLSPMDFSQFECFVGSQVSNYDPFLKDGRAMPANTIAAMYPWIYARISDKGGIRLGAQDGVPVFVDFFRRDSERINSNVVIIGKSGSGKSYGTKCLLANIASEDSKIFILDPENEYTELAHTLHGKIINVGNAAYGRLNPFHIITNLEDDEAETSSPGGSFSSHLQFLEEFFRQILPDVDKDALEYLNKLVERMYANFDISPDTDLSKLKPSDYPIFDDLYDIVLEDYQRTESEYLRNMLQTLINYVEKFATGGRNSSIWNGPSSITTDENFSVFNFQSLLANRNSTIANAQMLLVLKYIDNEIIKNRDYNRKYGLNRKIVVVIDEAHVFIDTKFPIALDFMFQLAKRIRKYNGMQIVITQNIKDFVGSEEIARKSTAIINACQYSLIFGLAPNDMDDLCKLYEKAGGINEIEQEQIITAPRGMAFAVMSPSSRSSFMINVPDTMVDMFEQRDYQTHYFNGEDGAEVWEEFVAGSRAEHDKHTVKKSPDYVYSDTESSEGGSGVSFRTMSAEQADQYIAERMKEREPAADSETAEDEWNAADNTPIAPEPEPEPAPPVQPEPPAQPEPPHPVVVQPVIDLDSLIRTIREEVRRELSQQNAAAAEAAGTGKRSEAGKEEVEPERSVAAPQLGGGHKAAKTEEPEEEKPAEKFDSSKLDFKPKFDLMALLDEQLESYSEMTLRERMQEIYATTMEISLDELDDHIKKMRRRKGA